VVGNRGELKLRGTGAREDCRFRVAEKRARSVVRGEQRFHFRPERGVSGAFPPQEGGALGEVGQFQRRGEQFFGDLCIKLWRAGASDPADGPDGTGRLFSPDALSKARLARSRGFKNLTRLQHILSFEELFTLG